MLELLEYLLHVAWHGQMYLVFLGVPIEDDANVSFAGPVSGYFRVLFECLFEVEGMFFSFVLDNKIIHH